MKKSRVISHVAAAIDHLRAVQNPVNALACDLSFSYALAGAQCLFDELTGRHGLATLLPELLAKLTPAERQSVLLQLGGTLKLPKVPRVYRGNISKLDAAIVRFYKPARSAKSSMAIKSATNSSAVKPPKS